MVSIAVIHVALRDDPALPLHERSARGVGRKASIAGAAGGGAAGVAAVSAAGVTGLSAAGISSGLAAIGATVGGGMAAGSAIVIAGPAVAAAAAGYGAYRAVRWLRRKNAAQPGVEILRPGSRSTAEAVPDELPPASFVDVSR